MKINEMKTEIIVMALIVLCAIALIYTNHSTENLYNKHLGEKYVIDKDTLTILDYSSWDNNYTLSDGRKVNYVLIVKD